MTVAMRNWAQNVEYSAAEFLAPGSLDELREAVRRAGRIKARGSGHSFNRIADTDGLLVSLERMPAAVDVDADRRTVKVAGGLRYGDVARRLDDAGFALANLASLPHIPIAGAVATGTHGSGDAVGPLSTAIASVDLLTADGDLFTIRRGDPRFPGAVVSLGALGILVALELDLVERFEVAQTVYEDVELDPVLDGLDEVTGLAYSVSLFTTWQDPRRFDRVWLKRVESDPQPPAELFAVSPAAADVHPVPGLSAQSCTPQRGVLGPWFERLPHFLLQFTPSVGDELQSEYFVDRSAAADAVRAVGELSDRIAPLLLVSEIRTMAPDEQWLSPTRGGDTVAMHFTWKADPAVERFLPELESTLAPFDARPHWGKLTAMPGERIAALYPRWDDFARLRRELDPRNVFANDFLARLTLI